MKGVLFEDVEVFGNAGGISIQGETDFQTLIRMS